MKRQSGTTSEPLDVNVLLGSISVTSGLNLGSYDYVSLTQASLTDTYVFKTGGSDGTTVATVVITFTSSAKTTLSTILKT